MITPRTLKGFIDSLPEQETVRQHLIKELQTQFNSFGFLPIDTPALEYSEVLLGKAGGETEKQVYRFQDHGKRDIALRFDLTVPFARFVSQHYSELNFPFKRYHIAKVWRGENTQKGRYREFYQCDFDTIGDDSASSDFDTLSLVQKSFSQMGINNITINISHRQFLLKLFSQLNIIEEIAIEVLRIIDKLHKIGLKETQSLLREYLSQEQIDIISDFILLKGSFTEILDAIKKTLNDPEEVTRIEEIYNIAKSCGIENYLRLDPTITRGLDYYTGIVFETFLTNLPSLGSICSGGRYNNLTSLYSKERMPGVGGSIGLDRLIAGLTELNHKSINKSSSIDILITVTSDSQVALAHSLANKLRDNKRNVEVYLGKKKLGQQFQLAEKKGIKFAVVINEQENSLEFKNLEDRQSERFTSIAELIEKLNENCPCSN